MARTRQMDKNIASDLFDLAEKLTRVARYLSDTSNEKLDEDDFRLIEDRLIHSLTLVRTAKQRVTPIHVKGQKA